MQTTNELFKMFCEAQLSGAPDEVLQDLWDRFCETLPPGSVMTIVTKWSPA
ncbi:MAG TPA: hypothetical protein VII44_02580 [Puia sp.]